MKKKVSFDFDECLGHVNSVQKYCEELLLRKDVEVWIVTSRPSDPKTFFSVADPSGDYWSNEDDLFPLAEKLGIPRTRIVFTEWQPKASWFAKDGNNDFVWHLDDNYYEIREIHGLTKVIPIIVTSPNWMSKCEKLLK